MPTERFVEGYADDPDVVEATLAEDDDSKYTARLVRGEVYYLRDLRFPHNCDVVIASHHKDHLEEHAVEPVGDDEGEVLVKDKFLFAKYTGGAPVGSIVNGKAPVDPDRDYEAEARMRDFDAKEKARKEQTGRATAPKFDRDARDATIVRAAPQRDNGPPARPRTRTRATPT